MTSSHVWVIQWLALHFSLGLVLVILKLRYHHKENLIYLYFLFLGMSKLRFKPAYNPYTEPSMEIFR